MPALNKRTIKVPDDYVRRIYLNQYRSAWIRAATSVFILLLTFGASLFQVITANNLMGIGAAVVFLCLMNPPLILLLKHSKSVTFSNIVSFVVSFSEITGYTIIIYFLGGIKSLWLSLIYVVLIYYVGMIGPRWRTFSVATCCWAVLSSAVALEYFGFIPSQAPFDFPRLSGRYQTAILVAVAVYLYGVAFVSDYMGALLRKRKKELKQANLELGQNAAKLKQAEKELRKSYVQLEKRVEERTTQLVQTNERLRQEIADRRQAEKALSASEETYRELINGMNETVWVIDFNGDLIDVNNTAIELLGYSKEELLTIGLYGIDSTLTRDDIKALVSSMPSDKLQIFETSHTTKDGRTFPVEVYSSLLTYQGKQAILSIARDITDRKRAEEELRKSEEYFKAIIQNSPGIILIVDKLGTITYASPSVEHVLGYGPDELIGTRTLDLIVSDDKERAIADFGRALLVKDSLIPNSFRMKHNNGTERTLEGVGNNLSDNPVVAGFVINISDVTERKQMEEELRTSRERLRALAGRLQAVREEERTQIAREIHDELGGALTGLKIDFSQLKRDALNIENEAVRASLLADIDPMITFTDTTIHTVRRIAMELRPGVLDDLGLVAALEWLLGDFQKRTGIRCEWIPSVEYIELDADLSTALFRIVQESLTNVTRHSGATEARVHLRAGSDSLILEIQDNGRGMEKEKIMDPTSLGFLGMRERALMFGGSFRVGGTPRTGTKVTVEIPLAQRGPDQEGDTG